MLWEQLRPTMLLAIDTSTRNASVALADGGRVVAVRAWQSMVNHSTELMPAVVQLMESRGVRPKELEAVSVALGPGGFSALRTGVSAAKGLALATGIPIIGVGSLDLEAYPFLDSGVRICALLEAGRGEAASMLVSPNGMRLREDRITGPDELLDELEDIGGGVTLFCGEGMGAWTEAIKGRLGSGALPCHSPPSARAGSLASLAHSRLALGDTDDLDSLQPNYLRMPSIGTPKRRDRTPQPSARRRARSRQGA